MILINLLPVRVQKKKETARQFVSVYFLSVLLSVAAMGYLYFSNTSEIEKLNARLSALQQEVAKYAKFEALLKDLTKKKELVDRKRTVIKSLQTDRDVIVRALAVLSIKVPAEKIWFERFNQAGDTISLDGVAVSNEAIVEFMRNLESSPYVDKGSVNLALSRQAVIENMKLRQFQLTYKFFTFSAVEKQLKTKTP